MFGKCDSKCFAMGLSTDSIFSFYVEEVNMERDVEDHYHGHELKYVPAGILQLFPH